MSGLTGQFYKQFAVTIAISTVISAINSLTLSPALAALLLKDHHAPRDPLTRLMDRVLGPFFGAFNRLFGRGSNAYGNGIGGIIQRKFAMTLLYGVLLGATVLLGKLVPGGFVPAQDKDYLVSILQLPPGASLDRTAEVVAQMGRIARAQPGVVHTPEFPGLNVTGLMNSSSSGLVFPVMRPSKERDGHETADAIVANLNREYAGIKGATIATFPPPPVQGLGTIGGFKLQIEDRGALGYEALNQAVGAFLAAAAKAPELGPAFSSYQINVPQLNVELDREKAKQLGVSVTDVFDTMQIYLGSLYVNDFNRFGRVYQVRAQADAPFRTDADSILQLKTRNARGEMVPLSSLIKVTPTYGPETVIRYNGFLAADINGGPAPGYSSGQAMAAVERIAAQTLPRGIKFEWTDLTYQQILTGDTALLGVPDQRAAGVPGAGRDVREPDAAAGDPADRADEHPLGAGGRLAHARRQQHLHADRPDGAGGAVGEERDPDRGIRARAGDEGTLDRAGRDRGLPAAPAPDPDDLDRLRDGRGAAGDLDRRRLGNASRDGHRRVLRHARRDLLRARADAGVLRAAAQAVGRPSLEEPPRAGPGRGPGRGSARRGDSGRRARYRRARMRSES